jgi:hypothetical protein
MIGDKIIDDHRCNYTVPHNLLYFVFEFQPMNPCEK